MAPTSAAITVLLMFLLPRHLVAIPHHFIMKVAPECGPNVKSVAKINIVTDLHITGFARCKDGKKYEFRSSNRVNHFLEVSYAGSGCVFFKMDSSNVYTVPIFIQWGSPASPLQTSEEQYQVTCTFDKNGESKSGSKIITDALLAPREIQTNLGPLAKSGYTLDMTNVLGNALPSTVDIGRMVKLTAKSDGRGGESGLRALSCDVVGVKTNKRYSILRAGCGDGMIFNKTAGFTTKGLTSISPYFATFNLFQDEEVFFDCNFTLCRKACDGSSCATVRRKRSMDNDLSGESINGIASNTVNVNAYDDELVGILDPNEPSPCRSSGLWKVLVTIHWEYVMLSLSLTITFLIVILVVKSISTRSVVKEPDMKPTLHM
ncbi:vitelline envelope sperm lysin receptor-like isoform X2 [Haliotis rubra]|uniref:vitelline envelope sperm lysin receptor-like isoform X2 n=1 Tax=Haliotis rubra TaxID=36100 RepID=UPI001EE6199D|nr:vitelline envelope sperm lysin receptor-like isoform X2 [Haliotis rubra]